MDIPELTQEQIEQIAEELKLPIEEVERMILMAKTKYFQQMTGKEFGVAFKEDGPSLSEFVRALRGGGFNPMKKQKQVMVKDPQEEGGELNITEDDTKTDEQRFYDKIVVLMKMPDHAKQTALAEMSDGEKAAAGELLSMLEKALNGNQQAAVALKEFLPPVQTEQDIYDVFTSRKLNPQVTLKEQKKTDGAFYQEFTSKRLNSTQDKRPKTGNPLYDAFTSKQQNNSW